MTGNSQESQLLIFKENPARFPRNQNPEATLIEFLIDETTWFSNTDAGVGYIVLGVSDKSLGLEHLQEHQEKSIGSHRRFLEVLNLRLSRRPIMHRHVRDGALKTSGLVSANECQDVTFTRGQGSRARDFRGGTNWLVCAIG